MAAVFFIQGDVIPIQLPIPTVVDQVYVAGDIIGVANNTANANELNELRVTGVFTCDKSSSALGFGDKVYFDEVTNLFTADNTKKFAGWCVTQGGVLSGDTKVKVRFAG